MTIKRNLSMVICVIMITIIMSTSLAFGTQLFTDVTNNHWAKDHINKIAENGITGGFPDATFRPGDSVTKMQAMVMIYNLINNTEGITNVSSLISKHSTTLSATGVSSHTSWASSAIAYALEYELISIEELRSFISNGVQTKATRSDIARYLSKAINSEESYRTVIVLPYIDSEMIRSNDIKYIDYLLDQGILSSLGDGQGRFNPNNNISRAEIAAMLSKGFDLIGSGTGNGDNNTEVKQYVTKNGTIEFLDSSSILIKFNDESTKLFQRNNSIEVLVNGVTSNFNALSLKQEVKITIEDDEKLIKVEGTNFVPDAEGFFTASSTNVGFDLVVMKEKLTNKTVSYRATASTKIQLDDKTVTLNQLKNGDLIKIKLSGQNIDMIVATSKTKTYQGTLQEPVKSLTTPVLMMMVNNEVKAVPVKKDVLVTRNGGRSSLSALKNGDIVVVTTEYEEGIQIQANSVITRKTGKIDSINITRDSKSIKLISNNEELIFSISDNIQITVNNVAKTLYDLRVDQIVEVILENDVIVAIDSRDDLNQQQITGTIQSIYASTGSSGYIVVDYLDRVTETYKHKSIYYTIETKLTSTKLQTAISANYLRVNNQIIIVGQEKENKFVADRIVLID